MLVMLRAQVVGYRLRPTYGCALVKLASPHEAVRFNKLANNYSIRGSLVKCYLV